MRTKTKQSATEYFLKDKFTGLVYKWRTVAKILVRKVTSVVYCGDKNSKKHKMVEKNKFLVVVSVLEGMNMLRCATE